jgi:hypothetical protein
MPVQNYVFSCDSCGFGWEQFSSKPENVPCRRCTRLGLSSTVSFRKKRSDAKKVGNTFGFNDSLAVNRPVRAKRKAAWLEDSETDDDESVEVDDEANDPSYAPAPPFDPSLRYSTSGSFTLTRKLKAPTTIQATPWTGITQSQATSRNTSAQFNGTSAEDHGNKYASEYKGARSKTGKIFEWCHLIADCLGGSTSAANLCCGSFHANTAMLCLENVLRGKTWLEVKVDVELRSNSFVAEKISYRVRKKSSAGSPTVKKVRADFDYIIDGLATGCTKQDGEELAGSLRTWLKANKLYHPR